jgi:2-desacetyl-2-hydroxyethyl bacteriochlorophyllide A dehydrogenase
MKAVIVRQPHDVILTDVPEPRVERGQVLVRVASVGICLSDLEIVDGVHPESISYPVRPGHEWSGTIVEVGPGVKGLRVGDRVAVEGHNYCGSCFWCRRGETNLCAFYNEFGFTLPGAYTEYMAVRADLAHPFAETLPFDTAALTEPAACVGHGILRARINPGDTVAIVGPGALGLLAVAWARLFGPRYIVVVGRRRRNEALAKQVGATHVMTIADDPVTAIRNLTDGRGADVVLETAGNVAAVLLAIDLARRGGTVILTGIVGLGHPLNLEADTFCMKDLRVHGIYAYTSAIFTKTLELIETKLLDVGPLVTHTFPLTDFAQAFDLLRRREGPVVKVILKP